MRNGIQAGEGRYEPDKLRLFDTNETHKNTTEDLIDEFSFRSPTLTKKTPKKNSRGSNPKNNPKSKNSSGSKPNSNQSGNTGDTQQFPESSKVYSSPLKLQKLTTPILNTNNNFKNDFDKCTASIFIPYMKLQNQLSTEQLNGFQIFGDENVDHPLIGILDLNVTKDQTTSSKKNHSRSSQKNSKSTTNEPPEVIKITVLVWYLSKDHEKRQCQLRQAMTVSDIIILSGLVNEAVYRQLLAARNGLPKGLTQNMRYYCYGQYEKYKKGSEEYPPYVFYKYELGDPAKTSKKFATKDLQNIFRDAVKDLKERKDLKSLFQNQKKSPFEKQASKSPIATSDLLPLIFDHLEKPITLDDLWVSILKKYFYQQFKPDEKFNEIVGEADLSVLKQALSSFKKKLIEGYGSFEREIAEATNFVVQKLVLDFESWDKKYEDLRVKKQDDEKDVLTKKFMNLFPHKIVTLEEMERLLSQCETELEKKYDQASIQLARDHFMQKYGDLFRIGQECHQINGFIPLFNEEKKLTKKAKMYLSAYPTPWTFAIEEVASNNGEISNQSFEEQYFSPPSELKTPAFHSIPEISIQQNEGSKIKVRCPANFFTETEMTKLKREKFGRFDEVENIVSTLHEEKPVDSFWTRWIEGLKSHFVMELMVHCVKISPKIYYHFSPLTMKLYHLLSNQKHTELKNGINLVNIKFESQTRAHCVRKIQETVRTINVDTDLRHECKKQLQTFSPPHGHEFVKTPVSHSVDIQSTNSSELIQQTIRNPYPHSVVRQCTKVFNS